MSDAEPMRPDVFCAPGNPASARGNGLHFRLRLGLLMAGWLTLPAWADLETPLRINAGGPEIGDPGGAGHWRSDREFVEGGKVFRLKPGHDLSQAESPGPAELYETVRREDHRYRFEGLPAGDYVVRFHFTDEFASDKRAMDYRINGRLVINNYNIHRAAGSSRQVHIVEVPVRVKRKEPLVIDCLKDKGNDVFEAALEILPFDEEMRKRKPELVSRLGGGSAVNTASSLGQRAAEDPETGPAELTEGREVRLVWLQGDRFSHYTDERDRLVLMGYDSGDGIGERALLREPGAFAKPLFTPDGGGIVYSDRRSGRIRLIDWYAEKPRDLGDGYAADVWRDPETEWDWVYLRRGRGGQDDPIVRRRIDDPSIEEMVWDRTENGQSHSPWFQLSGDGMRFADAFPWNHCGVGDPESGAWKRYSAGCWPGMAPDNSYRMFVFSGNHTEILLFAEGAKNRRTVRLATIPGIAGKKVYFPRWSNDPRLITVAAPEKDHRSEIYLGRFDPSFESIERWARVTRNDKADLYGDAWVQPNPAQRFTRPSRPAEAPTAAPEPLPWPGDPAGLVWLWESADAVNEAPQRAGDPRPHGAKTEWRGRSRPGPFFEMRLDGGFVSAEGGAGGRIAAAARSSGEFSFEMVVTPRPDDPPRPAAAVMAFSDGAGRRNLVLGQQGEDLFLAFGAGPERKLGRIEAGEPHHLLVACRSEEVVAWRNGTEIYRATGAATGIRNWEDLPLTFGAESGGAADWEGTLEAVAFYDRFFDGETVRRHWDASRQRMEARRPIPQAVVEGRLMKATALPEPGDIAPYRRALVENVYEVSRVASGSATAPGTRIVVLQWAILDGKPLPRAESRKEGMTALLTLEPASRHPELEAEFRSSDHAELDAPVYLDVHSHR